MQRSGRELWLALLAMVAVTAVYLLLVTTRPAVLASSALAGHGIGILGFLLMLMTETLYSLRKRARSARWGRMSSWLQFHIFTGLVGPYMVLLHTAWNFNGLAGIVTLMTVIVVASGVLGRYIYTAIPRTADGAEMEADELARQAAAIEAELQAMLPAGSGAPPAEYAGASREQERRIRALQNRQLSMRRQVASLATARHALATWHAFHVPIGIAMFTAAFIHVGAALYYATLLH